MMTGAASAQQRTFYDASDKVVGRSSTDSAGTVTNYDSRGRVISRDRRGWRSLRIGLTGPSEDVRRDCATALIEDIWCEKNPWLQLLGEATRLPKQNCAA
jgi:YD repeat-containing protein